MIMPRKLSYHYFVRSEHHQRTAMSHLYLLKLTSLSPEMTFALGCRTDFTAQWQQARAYTHRAISSWLLSVYGKFILLSPQFAQL